MTLTLVGQATDGRHRLGRPGLVSVSSFVPLVRRGFILAWFRVGRHRFHEIPRAAGRTPAPVHAV